MKLTREWGLSFVMDGCFYRKTCCLPIFRLRGCEKNTQKLNFVTDYPPLELSVTLGGPFVVPAGHAIGPVPGFSAMTTSQLS